MKKSYDSRIREDFSEEGIPHCAACGEPLDRQWRFYVKNGIPYCRYCILSTPAQDFLRICETDETDWMLDQGFEAWGRLPDGQY
ncbi:MAG: hypothetical protein IJR88_06680 [Clostridia bacterium]|nr:hypothetical protein [Clostridia bacterium]